MIAKFDSKTFVILLILLVQYQLDTDSQAYSKPYL